MSGGKPIKVAVVGLGRSGYNIHVARLRRDERFQITAVADWMADRAGEVAAELGCEQYPDHRSLIKIADAEVVVVATFSDTHVSVSRDVLRGGRHVVCEKPVSDSLPAARSLVQTAEKTGKRLLVHHNTRFAADTQHLLEVIRTKRIGEVFEIRMRAFDFSRRNDWQTLLSHHGGVMNNTCSHFIDAGLQFLEAPVVDVFCDLKQIAAAGDAEDHVKVVLRASNGRVYDMEVSSVCKSREPKWTVLGSRGTLVSDGSTSKIEWFDKKAVKPLKVVEAPSQERAYGNDDQLPWQSEEVPSRGPSIGDFYDNVWSVLREKGKLIVTPEQALEVVRITQIAKRKSGFGR